MKQSIFIILLLLLPASPASAQPAPRPITADDLPGFYTWGEEQVEIRNIGNSINMKGKYKWGGFFVERTAEIVLLRLPKAAEMSADIPEWARGIVEGTLKWELKLQAARDAEGRITFTGKCDYGKVVYQQERDRVSGDIKPLAARAEAAGEEAVAATFTRSGDLPPTVQHVEFSRKVDGELFYSDGWLSHDEAICVRVTYDPAPKADELDVTLDLGGGRKQVIKVRRDKEYNKRYVSDIFYLTRPKATTRPAR